MSTVDIPRGPGQRFEPHQPPGPWWWPARLDGELTAVVACPAGHTAHIDHDVAADGTVTPSLVCPEEDCGWHVFGRLIGWTP